MFIVSSGCKVCTWEYGADNQTMYTVHVQAKNKVGLSLPVASKIRKSYYINLK